MSTTAKEILSAAIGLINSAETSTGRTDTAANEDYKARTLLILNVLRGEVFPYSSTYGQPDGNARLVCGRIPDFDSDIGLDDIIAQTILPYGLAAQLLLGEDPAAASFFQQRYEELIARLGSGVPRSFEPIEDVYGGIQNSETGG